MATVPALDSLASSAANAWDVLLGAGVADLRPTPASIIDEGPQRTVFRYRRPNARRARGTPVLLVPPLAAPASCFDLRRGCSIAEHLIALGYPTYLVDYGPISFQDRALGLEHWVERVIPEAIATVSEDADGRGGSRGASSTASCGTTRGVGRGGPGPPRRRSATGRPGRTRRRTRGSA